MKKRELIKINLPPEVEQLYLEALRRDYVDGCKDRLPEALRFCAVQQVVMPEWVANKVSEIIVDWRSLKVRTLDEAFECNRPKGFHINANKKKRTLAPTVYRLVFEAQRNNFPITENLYEAIGEKLHIGKSAVKEYYEWAKDNMIYIIQDVFPADIAKEQDIQGIFQSVITTLEPRRYQRRQSIDHKRLPLRKK